jgi:fatty-acyl-CoA synthase
MSNSSHRANPTGDHSRVYPGRSGAHKSWLRALEKTAAISVDSSVTLPSLIDHLANRFGEAVALIGEEESLSYRAFAERCHRYARWALDQGIGAGDVVCLIMRNCPDYMAIWLGITRVGGVVALVNTNLVGNQLAHAINIVAPGRIIVDAMIADAVAVALPQLTSEVRCWVHGAQRCGFSRIDEVIERDPRERPGPPIPHPPAIMDRALFIYTSGTTGLPKAANVSHFRLMQWSHWFAGLMDTGPSDRMYNCLPMYHSIGGVVATGAILISGGSVVLRQRFSASCFWDDVSEWKCTIFQYIGELCRYLVNTPPHPRERQHRIRLCCGNGLRPEIWEEFQRRFGIPQILEFYAATEANFSLYNCEGKIGAIGRTPPFLAHRYPVALIKLDPNTGDPVRSQEGFCMRCSADEPGEAISQIRDDAHPVSRFEGYTDAEASERKVLRNVFANGDSWFRTGDLVRKDREGYFYFVDRLGDTFRWKGENVSTIDVADTLSTCPGVDEAIVYGVVIPGTEGRAGMAAIVPNQDFDLVKFRERIVARLPDYARPVLLRFCQALEVTGTFKPKKQDLAREGYDPALVADPIYFDDRARDRFVRLDTALYERIRSEDVRL